MMNSRRQTSFSTLSSSSVQSKKSVRSAGSSSSSKNVKVSTTSITAEEIDQMNKNLALMQYYNALERKQKNKKEEALKEMLEIAKTKEKELKVRQTELEEIKVQLAKMVLLRESVKLGEKAKSFIKSVINPVTCTASVSLNLSDSDFEKFKNILEAIKSNISDPVGRNLIEHIVREINVYRPPDNFISTVADVKMVEESKLLVQKIDSSASTITELKAEISKYKMLIQQFKVHSNGGDNEMEVKPQL